MILEYFLIIKALHFQGYRIKSVGNKRLVDLSQPTKFIGDRMDTLDLGYKYPVDFCETCPCPERRKTGICPAEKRPKKFILSLPKSLQKLAWEAKLVSEGHRIIQQ
jgi:hypothetical protein